MKRQKLKLTGPEWLLVRRRDRSTVSIKYRPDPRSPWQWGSSGVRTKKEASKRAPSLVAAWLSDKSRVANGWEKFRERYESEQLAGLAPKTQEAFRTAANQLDRLCPVRFVEEIDADRLSRFAAKLRSDRGTKEKPKRQKAEATIQAYRDHLMMALNWAVKIKLIAAAPEPPPIVRAKSESDKSRGRAVTREEAELIVAKLPAIVGASRAARWAWNLEALWRSGMRIHETFTLTWDVSGMHYLEGIDADRPMLVVSGSHEKGRKNRRIPLTPDFVALLREVPMNQRRGQVFRWQGMKGGDVVQKTVEKRIAAAGVAAKIVVGEHADGSPRYASAHDFRRAFGLRWATKVMPLVLMEVMRHQSIETTRKYYIGRAAEAHADALWMHQDDDFGDKLGAILENVNSVDPPSAYEKLVKHRAD